jgi:glutamine amidotransferase
LFYLALSFGLECDARAALERMVGRVECLRAEAGIARAFTFSAAATDGERVFAVRYSSDQNSPTLYHSRHMHALCALHDSYETLPDDAVVVLSEPLDDLTDHWDSVPESSFVTVDRGTVTIQPFVPKGE